MDAYKLKQTQLQAEIFRFLSIKAGQRFSTRGIANELGVTPTAISNSLPSLEKSGLIKIERHKTINLLSIEFNRDNQKAIELKRAENLKLIYESGLVEFLEDKYTSCTIILFGSYSRGEDVWSEESKEKKSDIDIAIIGAKEKKVNLTKFEKFLERVIFINYYSSWKIDKHLKNNILNGIVLKGSVEL